jgi:hypothetical protein
MGWFRRPADVPPQDPVATSDPKRSVDPLLFPQPLSPSRTRTQHNEDSTKVPQDPNTIPTPTSALVSTQRPRSSSTQLPQGHPPRAQIPMPTSAPVGRQHPKSSSTQLPQGRPPRAQIPMPTSAPISRQHPRTSPLPPHSPRRPPPRAKTLDTHDKGNPSGPRPPNPGESCA